jgi:hypothetical protein
MVGPVEFRFEIKAYTPKTMPLERLARYLSNLAVILGETRSVHLVRIEAGSTVPVLAVDWESLPKVRKRAHEIRSDEGSAEACAARRAIERDLAEDNAPFGDLLDHQGTRLLRFPGVQVGADIEYGPFSQPGTLDGVPIVVGGQKDLVPVHLKDRERIHDCVASRAVAKEISRHLFTAPVRVSGIGRWFRDSHGVWTMRSFTIHGFTELTAASVGEVSDRLQRIDAAWKQREDPIGDLTALRDSEA